MEETRQQSKPSSKDYLLFYVNGQKIIEDYIEPNWTLLWYLRNKLNLTGSKLGCGEGGCGACTVLVIQCLDRHSGSLDHRTVNACLTPIGSVDGCHIVTVEGLGSVAKANLHPTQSRLADFYGSQCGFCTPGIVMSLYGKVASSYSSQSCLTIRDIEEAFDGNLCRCTGYRPILDAAKTFANDIYKLPGKDPLTLKPISTTLDKCLSFVKENDQELNQMQFPKELFYDTPQSIHIKAALFEWYCPINLNELLHLRHTYPGNASKLIFGNTEVEIETKLKCLKYSRYISLTRIEELQQFKRTSKSLVIGAGVTLTHLQVKLTEWNNQKVDGGICQALIDQLKYFASRQIRNVASLGGNIVNASPISDINPILQAADATVELHRTKANLVRFVPLRDFFLGYRHVAMTDDEVLVYVHIPIPSSKNETFLRSYKQARRRNDDISIVSAGLQVELRSINSSHTQQWRIVNARFSFGGMGPTTILLKYTQQELTGQIWAKESIDKACELALKEMPLDEITPGGRPEYRYVQPMKYQRFQSFLLKFYLNVCSELHQSSVDSRDISAAYAYERTISHGQQTFPTRPSSLKVIGSSLSHRSAYLHTTGEAKYIDDMPSLPNTLHAALVLATHPNARIKHIGLDAASKVPGFISFINHNDICGSNMTGDVVCDEEIFVSSITPCAGAIIGVVLCENEQDARKAANLVHIEYELLTPTVFTIDSAIKHESYLGEQQCLRQNDVERSLDEAEHILEGTTLIGGQEHFYLETNCCMAIPSNDGLEIALYSSTQNPSKTQELTALALGYDVSHVTCYVKRMGGGFGGKESRSITPCVAIAIAAVKVARPVRLNIERDVDMTITGQRHPFKIEYKIGFTKQGLFTALDMFLWSNAGCSFDLSLPILQRAMLHVDNTYRFPNIRVRGRLCKTHLPSNTAFRGFGGPQGLFGCEIIIDHVATYLKLDPLVIRRLNMYKEGDITHFGQTLEHWNVPRLMDELLKSSDFIQRQKNIEEFNTLNKYRKRGMAILPTKFGIGFTAKFLNQAGALVHIYKDGSVLISHGGTEMGQGLHTKMVSVAAEVLGCDVSRIHISETATDKVPNTSPTAASASSDLNGMAIRIACEEIRERLNKLLVDDSDLSWKDLIKKAYFSRIGLSAHGHYATPEPIGADFLQNKATFHYFTQGAAVTEVELDALTGDWHILRADILMKYMKKDKTNEIRKAIKMRRHGQYE
ncbi:hypothetical protein I4U23_021809 [Adineta vaga]|nr:hypothetical protein I4U23_021809 [Adineta vaga]